MTRRLAEMTWPAVAGAVAAGAATVILPLGATEQHGPHLPLGTDTFRAVALADRLAAILPDALVAPALPIGCSDEHQGFAGLLSLDKETLAGVIVDCAHRMASWGVGRLMLLSAHGGNGDALDLAAARLAEEVPGLRVVVLGCATALSDAILAVAASEGIAADAVGLHAGEGETSEMLALRPDLVLMERIVPGCRESLADLMPRLRQGGLRSVTPTGTLGDASNADGARGARYLAAETEGYRRAAAASLAIEEGPAL
jgi:mycofactocin precursor peptide peptidase